MSNQKLIMCKGLPASGKSHFTKQYIKENPDTIRVNRDDIRSMLCQEWSQKLESVVYSTEKAAIFNGLKQGYSVIVDDTNLNPRNEKVLRSNLQNEEAFWDVEFEIKDFTNVDLKLCIQRDEQRTGKAQVGKQVIMDMYNKYLKQFKT